MSVKKRRLGRGLDALLDDTVGAAEDKPREQLREIPVELLQRGRYQPRTRMDEESLAELARSIESQGLLQPIVARALDEGRFEIVAGERRWRAAQLAGLETVPALVREIPDEAAIAVALIENIQRENLNPIEEATAQQRLIDEFGLTHQKIAERLGRSRAAVSNMLRLLSLGREARGLLESGQLEMGHARALLALDGAAQDQAARRVAERGLSVRETEALVRRTLKQPARQRAAASGPDPDVKDVEERLSQTLGARVRVEHRKSGGGRVVIEYHSLDELDGIIGHIR